MGCLRMKSNVIGRVYRWPGYFVERAELEVSDSGIEVAPNPTGVSGSDVEFVSNLSGVLSGYCGRTDQSVKVS